MVSILSAVYFDRKTEETVPVVTYIFMLLFYLAGIAGVIAHALELLFLYLAFGCGLFIVLGIRKKKKAFFSEIPEKIKSPGLPVFIILLVISILISLHLRITNWDDLHYWAIFPKDMFVINGVPTGGMSSTLYQDYFPVVQYLYFLVFKFIGRFSEPAMFAVNYFLILTCLLPFFTVRKNRGEYAVSVILGLILPSVCSYQLYYCLGVDIIMTFLFGSALICIFDEKKDLFYYIRFVSVTSVLTMTKTTGLIFAAIAIAVFAVENLKPEIKPISVITMTGAVNLLFYASWKVFCRVKGNTTYLSNVLNSNIEGKRGLALPDYAPETIRLFVKAFFTERLNGSFIGLSAAFMLLISLLIVLTCMKDQKEKIRKTLELAVMLCGMAGYLAVMLYIYLFVFDRWEALSLSSYERYIATFFGGILCASLYFLTLKEGKVFRYVRIAAVLVLLLTINYKAMYNAWTPWGFQQEYGKMVELIDGIDEELKGVLVGDLHYGDEIVFVDGKDVMARSKSIPYCAVPYVSRIMSLIDRESYTAEELLEMAEGRRAKYMVFMKRDPGEKAVVENESLLFADEGEELEEDVLYRYDPDRNVLVKNR